MHLALMWVLSAAPVVGPAIPVGAPITAPAGSVATQIQVATNGTVSTAIWLDDREQGTSVYTTQYSVMGAVLDAHDLRLDGEYCGEPSVTWFGGTPSAFFHTWGCGDEVRFRRRAADGTWLDASRRTLVTAPAYRPAVAIEGNLLYAVWLDSFQTPAALKFARFTPSGALATMPITLASGLIADPKISASQGAALVTWRSAGTAVLGMRVQPNGTLIDQTPLTLATTMTSSATGTPTATNTGWFVGLREGAPTGALSVRFVPASGPPATAVPITTDVDNPSFGWDDTNQRAIVLWADGNNANLMGVRVSPSLGVIDVQPIVLRTARVLESAVTFHPASGIQVTWNERRLGYPVTSGDLYGGRFSAALVPLDGAGTLLSQARNFQDSPRLATDGVDYLVVWQDYQPNTGWDIWAAKASAGLDGGVNVGVPFSVRTSPGEQHQPRVAYSSGTYLVAWNNEETDQVEIARVSAAGQLIDINPILLPGGGGESPVVAGSSDRFLVAYASNGLKAWRLSPDGGWLDAAPITVNPHPSSRPHGAAAGAGDFAIVFGSTSGGNFNIWVNRVGGGGTVLDGMGSAVTVASSDPAQPNVVFDGTRYFVGWHDHRLPGNGTIFGVHVADAGVVGTTAFQVGPANGEEQEYPSMARVGSGTFLVWAGQSNTMKWQALHAGAITPAVPMVSGYTLAYPELDLVANPSSMMLAHIDLLNGDRRVFVRTVALGAPGTACAQPWECQSGTCTLAVCVGVADAGPPDAGTIDAGTSDAGTLDPDAGLPLDGGQIADGGISQQPVAFRVGCGCSHGTAPLLFALLLGLALRRRVSEKISRAKPMSDRRRPRSNPE